MYFQLKLNSYGTRRSVDRKICLQLYQRMNAYKAVSPNANTDVRRCGSVAHWRELKQLRVELPLYVVLIRVAKKAISGELECNGLLKNSSVSFIEEVL